MGYKPKAKFELSVTHEKMKDDVVTLEKSSQSAWNTIKNFVFRFFYVRFRFNIKTTPTSLKESEK